MRELNHDVKSSIQNQVKYCLFFLHLPRPSKVSFNSFVCVCVPLERGDQPWVADVRAHPPSPGSPSDADL
jgi:hypothetical protein